VAHPEGTVDVPCRQHAASTQRAYVHRSSVGRSSWRMVGVKEESVDVCDWSQNLVYIRFLLFLTVLFPTEFQRNNTFRRISLGTVPGGFHIFQPIPLEKIVELGTKRSSQLLSIGIPRNSDIPLRFLNCCLVKWCFREWYKKHSITLAVLIIYSFNMSRQRFRVTPSYHSPPPSQPLGTPPQPETPVQPSAHFRWASISTPSSITQPQRSLSHPVLHAAPGIPFTIQSNPNFRLRAKRFLLTYSQVRTTLDQCTEKALILDLRLEMCISLRLK